MKTLYQHKTLNSGEHIIETKLYGEQLLNFAYLNKSTAFSTSERTTFGLHGKLPPQIETLDTQVARTYQQYQAQPTDLLKNIFLHELHASNQTLFYSLVQTYLEEILPILYTPNVANAVTTFSHEFRRPLTNNALFISYPEREHLKKMLEAYDPNLIDLIVVTDGEGVLGIGDQGLGSIHIPIAKSMLYTLFAGIDPQRVLSIVIDVGTNNQTLLNDPFYLGWRHPRLSGEQYLDFIDYFINIKNKKLPQAFLHWEDFGRENAPLLLNRYREQICSFNDDIQGTAVVTLAALLAALKSTRQTWHEQRIVIFGAGTAGTGIANQIILAMQQAGLSTKEAYARLWLIDKEGLLTTAITNNITPAQQPFLRSATDVVNWQLANPSHITLTEVVHNLHPTILLGCSTQAGAFTESIIRKMAQHTIQPIIFPLSNPTTKCEATPENLLQWTEGKALIASGSPFAPGHYQGKIIPIAQCNNALAFPGIGLGVLTAKATKLTDSMLWAACQALLDATPLLKQNVQPKQECALLPPLTRDAANNIALKIAHAVALQAYKEGLSKTIKNKAAIPELIQQQLWHPQYVTYSRNQV